MKEEIVLSAKRLIRKHKDKSDECKSSKEQQKASKRNKRRWRNCEYHFKINKKSLEKHKDRHMFAL